MKTRELTLRFDSDEPMANIADQVAECLHSLGAKGIVSSYPQPDGEVQHDEQIAVLLAALAECYRLTGADPDGNEDWRLASNAIAEVRRLREQADETEVAFHTAVGLLSEILSLDLERRVKELLASKNLKR